MEIEGFSDVGVGETKKQKTLTEFLKEHKVQSSEDIEKIFPTMDEKLKNRNNLVNSLLNTLGPARVEPYFDGIRFDVYETVASITGLFMFFNDKTKDASFDYIHRKPSNYDLVWEDKTSKMDCKIWDGGIFLSKEYHHSNDSWSISIRERGFEVQIQPPKIRENYEDFQELLYIVDQHLMELGIVKESLRTYKNQMPQSD